MIDMRTILPNRSTQLLRATFENPLGSRWKAMAFRHIDRTSFQVFDIAANTGEHTHVFKRTVGSHCTCAIEPERQLSSRLKRLAPDLKVLSIALSDTRDAQNFKIPTVNGKPLLS